QEYATAQGQAGHAWSPVVGPAAAESVHLAGSSHPRQPKRGHNINTRAACPLAPVSICRAARFASLTGGIYDRAPIAQAVPVTRPPSQPLGAYPRLRMRRNRRDDWTRRMVAEHTLTPADFIWPVFVHDERAARAAVASMPHVDRLSIPALVDAVGEAKSLGIPCVALFPVTPPARKSPEGDEAVNPENLVCRAVRAVKAAHPDLGVLCDVALDPFTTHGHDGVLRGGEVANDATVEILTRQALVQAEAGCDIIAPS